MEEDIKILEEFFKDRMDIEQEIQALENLIKGYRELEERNIYLVNERKKLEELLFMSNENYIEKSKIKEKIEELESKIKATFCKYMTEEDYYNNKFLSSDVAEDYEVLEVRELISNRNLLQELMAG